MTLSPIRDNLKLAIIAYAKTRPCIWDEDVAFSQEDREEAWNSFSEGFRLPVPELKKRWAVIHETYCSNLKESISTSVYPKWPCFSKLDEFLRTPTLKRWRQDGSMQEQIENYSRDHIEYIDLSSDSDGEFNKSEGKPAQAKRVNSPDRNPEKSSIVKLQTAEDVRNELRKIPQVAGSSGAPRNEPSTSGILPKASNVYRRLNLNKKRKSLPEIPDAKRRLIKNYRDLIPLKKFDPKDTLSRSLPPRNSSSISSPPHKMFGSSSTKFTPNIKSGSFPGQSGKSVLKKMKRKLEKIEGKQFKKRSSDVPSSSTSSPAPVRAGTSGNGVSSMSSSEGREALTSNAPKLPLGTALSVVSSSTDLPKVTVHLTPSTEGVTLHSVPATSREESLISSQDVLQQDQSTKPKKTIKDLKSGIKRKSTNEHNSSVTNLIELDDSDSKVSTTERDNLESRKQPDARQQSGVDQGKPYSLKRGEDIWKKWEAELSELPKVEDEKEDEEGGDIEAETEVRKNFLLSLLPDMAAVGPSSLVVVVPLASASEVKTSLASHCLSTLLSGKTMMSSLRKRSPKVQLQPVMSDPPNR